METDKLALYVANKIKTFRKANRMTQQELAEKLGVSKQTVSKYEKAIIKAHQDTLFRLVDIFGVKIDDFFPPIKKIEKVGTDLHVSFAEPLPPSDDILMLDNLLNTSNHSDWVDYGKALLEKQFGEIRQVVRYSVEIVTELAAGLRYSYDDNDIKTVLVEEEPPRYDIASLVNGDSMLPDYENGDVVYLKDTGMSSYSGQVCAVAVNDKSYLKKVYTEDDCLRLVSINPKYDDIIIDFPPAEDTHIKIYAVIGSDKVVQD